MINRYMKNVLIFILISIFLINKSFSNDAHTNLISLLEMNYPIEFIFEQKYNSDKINGWMVIAGNGMARTEFAPPNNNLIVADGKWIMFYDPEIDRTTYIPLDKGIFKAFLKPTALIGDKIFQVKEIKENKTKIDDQEISDVLTVNGVRFSFDDGSWGLIRASSNKPSLVIVIESLKSYDEVKEIFNFINSLLDATGKVGEYDQSI